MGLFTWQVSALEQTVAGLERGLVINASDTGTGKTFVTLEALKAAGKKAVVWCPKTVIGSWYRVAEVLGCLEVLLDVKNPEQIAFEKTPWFHENRWHMPEGSVLVVDEVHRGCSGVDSKQTKVLALTKAWNVPVIAMSATVADSPLKLRALGFLAGLHQFSKSDFYSWCRKNGCYWRDYQRGGSWEFPKGPKGREFMAKLHEALAPFLVRIRIADVPEFPTTSIQPLLLTLPDRDTEEFHKAYEEMDQRLRLPGANEMVEILRARQRTEWMKIKPLVPLIEDSLEEGKSVVVFVQFRDSLKLLKDTYGTNAAEIHGDQTSEERQRMIDAFQTNRVRCLFGIMSAGGLGVSLHDVNGTHPRVAFHTPPWSAAELRQAFGRVWRAGGTHSVQHVVLADKTVEDRVYKSVMAKAGRIDSLQDGDLK